MERKHRTKRYLPILVVLSIIGASIWLKTGIPMNPSLNSAVGGGITTAQQNLPTPGHEESAHRLGTSAPLIVTRVQGEPAGGDQIISDSIFRVSQATGLKFINDGKSSETPSFQRASYQPNT